MKNCLLFFLSTLLLFSSCRKGSEFTIVGKWRMQKICYSGMASWCRDVPFTKQTTIEFFSNGQYRANGDINDSQFTRGFNYPAVGTYSLSIDSTLILSGYPFSMQLGYSSPTGIIIRGYGVDVGYETLYIKSVY